MSSDRYPGAKPFETNQSDMFFGRDDDLLDLRRKVVLQPLAVLYGKSGLGKSSLVNAGLIDLLIKEGEFEPLRIRFRAYQENKGSKTDPPVIKSISAIKRLKKEEGDYLTQLVPNDETIWRAIKEHLYRNEGNRDLLLIFDQFEELFTYPKDQVLAFKSQLAEALYTAVPERYWNALEEKPQVLDRETIAALQERPRVRTLLVVRSDRMHLLEKLSDYLPLILHNCQELNQLDLRQAREAIVKPAQLEGGFFSHAFKYEPDAIADILSFLTDGGSSGVETTQLQIICRHLEKELTISQSKVVSSNQTEDLEPIVENYYEERIREISSLGEQYAARVFVEDVLIFSEEERRLSIYEGQILKYISSDTLKILVDGHLLRAETSFKGGYTYELSHDTLVAPILKARAERVKKEQLLAEKEAKALLELERKVQKRKRLTAYSIAAFGVGLAILAAVFGLLAQQARNQTNLTLFRLQFESARRLKGEGDYQESTAILKELEPLSSKLGTSFQKKVSDTAAIYKKVQKLVLEGKEMERSNLRLASEKFNQALDLSSDNNLQQLVSYTEDALEKRIDKLKKDYRNFLRDNSEEFKALAETRRLQILKLDPAAEKELDSIKTVVVFRR